MWRAVLGLPYCLHAKLYSRLYVGVEIVTDEYRFRGRDAKNTQTLVEDGRVRLLSPKPTRSDHAVCVRQQAEAFNLAALELVSAVGNDAYFQAGSLGFNQ